MVKILLVEKDLSVARLYREEMEEAGFTVLVFRGLGEAMIFLRERSVDVLVTDECTCAYSSPRWLRMVRRVHSGPVVALASPRARPRSEGGCYRLTKSSDLEPLINSLKSSTIGSPWEAKTAGSA